MATGTEPARREPRPMEPRDVTTPSAVIEQYKAKVSDLGNLGTRLSAMTTYYVSILTALLGVLAFKERSLAGVDGTIIGLVGAGGLGVSLLWLSGVTYFRHLFRVKLAALECIERSMPFDTFRYEFESLKAIGSGGWLWMERIVPTVFAVLFGYLLVARFAP